MLIDEFISTISMQNIQTAKSYKNRLKTFDAFSISYYNADADKTLPKLKQNEIDVYDFLNKFVGYLLQNNRLSSSSIKQYVITAKNFIEYNDVDVSPLKFKLKVKMRRAVRTKKHALSKEDIIKILNSCNNMRLKTYVMLLVATGMRAQEPLTIRIKDIDFKSRRLVLRGDYTKTKIERIILLTEEVVKQLEAWLDYKYRTKRVQSFDKSTNRWFNEYTALKREDDDLVFAALKTMPKANSLYIQLCKDFDKTLDRIGMGSREESNRRRLITLHSFRRFVKSTITDLGHYDFSEYFIGHIGSTYYRKTDKQIADIFKKVEPHLTFLDYSSLERKGADIQTKIETLEQENARLRQIEANNKGQLTALAEHMSGIENKMDDKMKMVKEEMEKAFVGFIKDQYTSDPDFLTHLMDRYSKKVENKLRY